MDPVGLEFHDLDLGKVFKNIEDADQFMKNWGAKHLL